MSIIVAIESTIQVWMPVLTGKLLVCKREKHSYNYLLKNSMAVKKGAAQFKMASVKKFVKSKGAAKKWL